MKTIDFTKRKEEIVKFAETLFAQMWNLTKMYKPEEKKSLGIRVYLHELKNDKNFVLFSVLQPSIEAEILVIANAVRAETLGHYSSQNSENPKEGKTAGSVTLNLNFDKFQASVTGLTPEQNAFCAVVLLAYATEQNVGFVVREILDHAGELPSSFFEKGHYLEGELSSLEYVGNLNELLCSC